MLIPANGRAVTSTHSGFRHYELARQSTAWNPRTAIAWNSPTTFDTDQQELAWRIASQASHAEQAGLVTAARLLGETEDYPARLALATAVSDEAKHSEVFARYALQRGGEIPAPQTSVQKLADTLDAIDDYLGRFVVHTLLEGFAADEMQLFIKAFQGDVLADIYTHVRQDESRHVGIGLDYLSHRFQTSSVESDWDVSQYETIGLELSGMNNDATYTWLASIGRTDPVSLRAWFLTRHRARMRRFTDERR